jgi:DNA-binding response OmpR family regulator
LKNILYIDDNINAGILAKIFLEKNGFHVYVSKNTEKARSMLLKKIIHLIITDVGLPGESGIDFYKWLQSHPDYKAIPVLIVSGHAVQFNDVLKKHEDIFIAKPVFFPKLIDRICQILNIEGQGSEE